MSWRCLGVLVLVVSSCTAPNPASCADGNCTDPSLPFCDVDGSIGGIPETCIAVTCDPLAFDSCRGDQALVCNSTGMNFDILQCELGCDSISGCRSACTTDSDCESNQPVCTNNVCGACSVDDQCASRTDTPFCDTGAGSCVECNANAQCDASTPVCSGNTCRTCLRDDECDSGACDLDGTCVPESAIIYISNVNPQNGGCTRTAPCGSVATVFVTPTKNHFVALEGGTFLTALNLSAGGQPSHVFIHGHGATLQASTGTPQIIISHARTMTIRDVTITGPTSLAAVNAFGPTTLDNVRITGAMKLRVRAPVVARDFAITNSIDTESILLEDGADLTIDGGSILRGEAGIRAAVVGTTVHLKNMLISQTNQRALELAQATGEVDFSTIADSGAQSTAAPCSVACNANLRVVSSIIFQEMCGGAIRDAAGACTFTSSIVSNAPAPGITNIDPQFVNRAGGNYHIQATSPAKDAVDTGPAFDFEGDARPRGLKFDIGADEAP